ncbi:hypothetical protein [Anabaena azotica]|uniref:Uncharacterized protein n=1 Tax=Anabaena azotica FACHB-119 TaxID=947527 RepID=A0ABR8DAQ3_9NOST|nr:hypothetical protein [Anabaena azotica]MBD2503226.1 hypothetical protein [Anabaena azotica FACHB-119]
MINLIYENNFHYRETKQLKPDPIGVVSLTHYYKYLSVLGNAQQNHHTVGITHPTSYI